MASQSSFDVTTSVDLQEVDNAVNQARKEIAQRYDFKGSRAAIDLNQKENTLTLTADDEFKMTAVWEIQEPDARRARKGRQRYSTSRGDPSTGDPDRGRQGDRQVPEGP